MREVFFIFLLSLGGEQAVVEDTNRPLEGLGGSEFQAVQRSGVHHALHGVHIKLSGKGRADLVADGTADLAILNEATKGVGDTGAAHFLDVRVDVRCGALDIAENLGPDVAEFLRHGEGKAAEFFEEGQAWLAQDGVYFRAHSHGEAINGSLDNRVLAGEVHIEGLFAHTEFTGEVTHGERAVAKGKKVSHRLGKYASSRVDFIFWNRGLSSRSHDKPRKLNTYF